MMTRPIPKGAEALPVIGLGTWQTFDVGPGASERRPLAEVLKRFFAAGGKLIDSSPMYGRAESVVGDLLREGKHAGSAFLATKVWTTGREAGDEQMRQSLLRMGTERMDLMQIHNLVDWQTHLETLRAWKAAGRIRYLGITHYQLGAFPELERLIKTEKLDFIQLPYSVAVREAEKRLLPAAADSGTAVIVMRPFEGGTLFRDVRSKPLPAVAAALGCTSWAQLLLKFIVSHPAVTCAIPATSNPEHVADNMRAGAGPMADEPTRKKILAAVGL
jgi:diketogulonate reductase-like aldo/keto reductase